MNLHTSSKQRKSVNSSGSMMKTQSAKNYNIIHNILDFHQSSSRGTHMLRCGQVQINRFTVDNPRLPEFPAIIMVSLGLQPGQEDIHPVEIRLVEATTIQIEVKVVEVMAADLIPLKDELLPTVLAACLVLVLLEAVEEVVMDLVALITHTVVHMGLLALDAGIAISSISIGSNSVFGYCMTLLQFVRELLDAV